MLLLGFFLPSTAISRVPCRYLYPLLSLSFLILMHMAALEPHAYRKSDLLRPVPLSSAPGRRATVGSPPPFIFSNSFEALRPSSRNGSGFPYRRRSTVSGHSQGHNVNDAPPLVSFHHRACICR